MNTMMDRHQKRGTKVAGESGAWATLKDGSEGSKMEKKVVEHSERRIII